MKNQKVRDSFKPLHCIVCGVRGCDPCHLRTYGATREDDPENIVPMCRRHHVQQGAEGFKKMSIKYPRFERELNARGFFIEQVFGVWKLVKK